MMKIDSNVLGNTGLMSTDLVLGLENTLMHTLECVRERVRVCVIAVAWRGLRTRRRARSGRAPGPGGSIRGRHPLLLRIPRKPPSERAGGGGGEEEKKREREKERDENNERQSQRRNPDGTVQDSTEITGYQHQRQRQQNNVDTNSPLQRGLDHRAGRSSWVT